MLTLVAAAIAVLAPLNLNAASSTETVTALARACDRSANRYLDTYTAERDEVRTRLEAILKKYKYYSFSTDSCSGLPVGRADCVAESEEFLSSIYSPELEKRANSIFQQAQRDLVLFLKQRHALFRDDLERKLILSQMRRRVENSKLAFELEAEGGIANSMTPESPWLIEAAGLASNSVIRIGPSAALLANAAPEGLYFILLHELGHTIDLKSFRFDDHYSQNPFSLELQCLKRADSVKAKSSNFSCLRESGLAEKYVRLVAENPDTDYRYAYACQRGQLSESFADWIATEVSSQRILRMNDTDGYNAVLQIAVPDCSSIAALERAWPQMTETAKRSLLLDSHPLGRDRMERILLANPIIRDRLGYPSRSYSILKDINAETGEAVVYCGLPLY